ncbi:MAG: alpha/beta fold hydrolase [Aquincola sp.]|nr:alpha/beta fold hydrolase [Aquincola sp.]
MFGAEFFWQNNVPELAKSCRVIALDPRGIGLSGKPNRGFTIEQFARDLRELILHLDLHDVVLAGLSLGGFTSLEYLRQFGNDRLEVEHRDRIAVMRGATQRLQDQL